MIAEAVISMLAVARIGAVHSVIFGGFSASLALNPAAILIPRTDSPISLKNVGASPAWFL
jgi:hypothetical protein